MVFASVERLKADVSLLISDIEQNLSGQNYQIKKTCKLLVWHNSGPMSFVWLAGKIKHSLVLVVPYLK